MSPLEIPRSELFTIRDWVRWITSQFEVHELFFGHGTDNAFDEALELVLATLRLPHDLPESWLDARVTAREVELLAQRILQRVEQRLPLPYVTGRAFFAGLEFEVNPNVLIPRSPIAELIGNRFQPWIEEDSVGAILDLCCGSGCIGIACAYAFPDALVDLADISPSALDVASRNIERHGLEDRVRALQSDVFEELDGELYRLIVSNPPYVSTAEMGTLPAEYLHEPELGLEAGGDGMQVVSRILAGAPDYLTPDGILVLEVGASADLLMARYPDVPFLWLDFEHGGDGVFLLDADQLTEFHEVFLED